VVVGSGPGGGLVARSLAEQGASVIVVEAGPWVRIQQYSRDIGETFARYFWEGGLRASRGNTPMPSLQGRCLGGGSVFNSAICMRIPDWGAARWRDEHGIEGCMDTDLAPFFERVEDFLHIAPTGDDVLGPRNELFRDGARAMGFDPSPILRSVDGCRGSAKCILGCRNGAKMSVDRRGIPEALERGARVYTSVHVDKVLMRGNRAVGVVGRAVCPTTGRRTVEVRITARNVIMAAGAFHTPVILQRSGVEHPQLGRNLRMHPGGILLAKYDREVVPWVGATQGYHVEKFLPEGIKLESAWTTQALFASNFKGTGAQFKDQIADYRHIAAWDTWASGDGSDGSVRGLPGGMIDIQFDLGEADARRLQEGIAKLGDMAFASGATRVFTTFPEPWGVLYDEDDVNRFRHAKIPLSLFTTGSNHIFGTTAMGGNPKLYPCDSTGAVRGTENLWVCDTGLFPGTPGANPMLTLMALAERMGDQLGVRG
jgi:choline dehydrogenase-like flavoprotein